MFGIGIVNGEMAELVRRYNNGNVRYDGGISYRASDNFRERC